MLYFAYGMNLDPRTMSGATKVDAATLQGWKLAFRGYADIEEAPGECVLGGLWDISVPGGGDILAMLDRREGYPAFYDRRTVNVMLPNGGIRSALVYFMRDKGPLYPPHEGYMRFIEDGRAYFNLPTDDLQPLIEAARNATEARYDGR